MDGKGASYTRLPNCLQSFGHGSLARPFSYKYKPLGSRIAMNFLKENSGKIVRKRRTKREVWAAIARRFVVVFLFRLEGLAMEKEID
ncbi:hypothetical protein Bca52824_010571 [Brassica carinata]|uniref:Uncharacterized protein n=1 Tax=Brassica carinata TaxID=52824 RepID=A0A8X7WBQ6_BRACI|nr:hypothetical protein Bca52824_010571 [Brassica carinata]